MPSSVTSWQFQQKYNRSGDPNNAELSLLFEQAMNRTSDDASLRAMITKYGLGTVNRLLISCPETIAPCSACRLWCWCRNQISAYGGAQAVCTACASTHYRWCDGCRGYVLSDDRIKHFHIPEMVTNGPLNSLHKFNTNIMQVFGGSNFYVLPRQRKHLHTRYFGIELEIEKRIDRPLPPDLIAKAVKCFPQGFVIAKRDGSLSAAPGTNKKGTNGFELSSAPGTLGYHLSEASGWDLFFEVIAPYAQPKPPSTGLHFHVSLASISPLTLGKADHFVNTKHNLAFLMDVANRNFNAVSPVGGIAYAPTDNKNLTAISGIRRKVSRVTARRDHSEGCPRHPRLRDIRNFYYDPTTKGFTYDLFSQPIIVNPSGHSMCGIPCKCRQGHYTYKDHYAAFNLLTHKATVELRLFQGSMNPLHFKACLEFCDALFNFCACHGLEEMKHEAFTTWLDNDLRKVYPNLTTWLVQTGHLQAKGKA